MANYGKISRLPADLRNEVCLRLYNGEGSAAILPWLNADAGVQKVLSAQFDGEPITAQNLSAWKQNEYAQWLRRRQKVQDLKELSCFASEICCAFFGVPLFFSRCGGTLSEHDRRARRLFSRAFRGSDRGARPQRKLYHTLPRQASRFRTYPSRRPAVARLISAQDVL